MDFHIQLSLAALAGFICHWTYFVHGERDLAAAKLGRLYLIACIVIPLIKSTFEIETGRQAVRESAAIGITFTAALFSSVLVYRFFLSPLKHIPGPLSMRLTKLTHAWRMARVQNCVFLDELHEKYGDVVRTGKHKVLF